MNYHEMAFFFSRHSALIDMNLREGPADTFELDLEAIDRLVPLVPQRAPCGPLVITRFKAQAFQRALDEVT